MDNPRRGRVVEQHFLNLPGFHAGAYIRAYVEDTSEREACPPIKRRNQNYLPGPRLVLEISDCYKRIELDFDVTSAEERLNSFHKIDTLIAALVAFREGMSVEATLHRRRERIAADQEKMSNDGEAGPGRSSGPDSAVVARGLRAAL
jgi:hypothetical protein